MTALAASTTRFNSACKEHLSSIQNDQEAFNTFDFLIQSQSLKQLKSTKRQVQESLNAFVFNFKDRLNQLHQDLARVTYDPEIVSSGPRDLEFEEEQSLSQFLEDLNPLFDLVDTLAEIDPILCNATKAPTATKKPKPKSEITKESYWTWLKKKWDYIHSGPSVDNSSMASFVGLLSMRIKLQMNRNLENFKETLQEVFQMVDKDLNDLIDRQGEIELVREFLTKLHDKGDINGVDLAKELSLDYLSPNIVSE